MPAIITIRSLVGGSPVTDDITTRLNTEDMTKAFYKAFPTVVTLEDAMRQALSAAEEIERLRTMLAHGLVFGSTCKGCDVCKQLKLFHKKTIDKIALENQSNGNV